MIPSWPHEKWPVCERLKLETTLYLEWAAQVESIFSKESTCNAGDARDAGSIPELGQFPGGGNGNPPQYSCLENPMNSGAWWVTVYGIAKSWT